MALLLKADSLGMLILNSKETVVPDPSNQNWNSQMVAIIRIGVLHCVVVAVVVAVGAVGEVEVKALLNIELASPPPPPPPHHVPDPKEHQYHQQAPCEADAANHHQGIVKIHLCAINAFNLLLA